MMIDRLENHGFINYKFAGIQQVYGIRMEDYQITGGK